MPISIFDYTDFRKFIADFYQEKKLAYTRFSYRSLASQAGINPGNFTKMLKGERNLTLASAVKLGRLLKLSKRGRDYFQAMVLFSQAKNHEEKKKAFEELMAFKESSAHVLEANQYVFYDEWYYTAVREALAIFPLTDENFADLGKCIIPAITSKQVAKAIQLLLNLGLIQKNSDGLYKRTSALISTGNDIRSLVLNNFVINTMKLAELAINQGLKSTNLSSVTLSISQQDFEKVQEVIRNCRRRIMEIAEASDNPEAVYQLNIQLFPMFKPEGEVSP